MGYIVKITKIAGTAVPIRGNDIDTDRIIPARYLKEPTFARMGDYPFFDERFDGSGKKKDHPFNDPEYKGASILFVNKNFGCGSSREHAPWALQQYGFKVIIAPSFADIFYNNSFNTGLLPIILKPEEIDELFQEVENEPMLRLRVNLEEGTVTAPGGKVFNFQIDPFKRDSLLKGLDNIGWTLQFDDLIEDYETKHQAEQPWLYAGQPG